MKEVIYYQCEYCLATFSTKIGCVEHEKDYHKCPRCKHSYYVYGCELNCDRLNNKNKCKFEER